MPNPQTLLTLIVVSPLAVFLLLGAVWVAGWQVSERAGSRISAGSFLFATGALALLTFSMRAAGWAPVSAELGDWFSAGTYTFRLQLLADSLSLPLLALTVILAGLIGAFSSRYLHRDRGYFRFFLLLHLFAFGAELAFTAGSLDLLIGGWELVGFTSVMLIAFFNDRTEPVRNSLRAFAVYRMADVGLLIGVFVLHHAAGTASIQDLFYGAWPRQDTALGNGTATVVALLFLLAAAGKSAQAPFSGWLPRAMEGPTPSSAIFYGGISVHLGVYLMLRAEPILQTSPIAPIVVIIVGLITAIHATLAGRVATDAKTILAYATLGQLGVIFIEVGLGFNHVALYHLLGHAAIRTLQFLRAPSMLHDYHRVHSAAGGHFPATGTHYERILPAGFRSWLYRLALDRCHLDTFVDRFVAGPAMRVAGRMVKFEYGDHKRTGKSPEHVPLGSETPEMAGRIDA
jgi:NADH-quinone oxidoreductase subunit L